MNITEAEALVEKSGGSAETAQALLELYPEEIEEYTREDFLDTEKPYAYIYLHRNDKFTQRKLIIKMAAQAKKVGVSNFPTLYKLYASVQPDDPDTETDNYTSFTDQQLTLRCGNWICDDSGVRMQTEYGIVYACPHPIMPVERMCNIDTGIEKVKVAFRRNRAWRTAVFDRKTLSAANKIIDLADCGIAVTSETARDLVKYFYEVEQDNADILPETECVTHMGWIDRGEGLEFVPYTKGVVFDGEAEFRGRFNSIVQKGDFKKWLDCMEKNIRRNPHPMARIVFSSALASVLIKLLNCNCYWLHLWGSSGTAKTALTMCAASIWGNPERGKFLTTFNSTYVGNEKGAAFSGSMPYMLDELQILGVKRDMDNLIYMLTEGCGRSRGNKQGGLDAVSQWKNCVISTGEEPINNANSGGGSMARVVEVECKRPFFGDDDNARKVLSVILENHGFFGAAFVEYIRTLPEGELEKLYESCYKSFSDRGLMDKQIQTGALILAADKLACDMYFDESTALSAYDIAPFLKTKEEVNVNARGYEFICEQVASNQFRFIRDERPTELWGALDGDHAVYIIKSVFARMCFDGGYNPSSLLSWLDDRGLIERNGKNLTVPKRVDNVLTRCVHLTLYEAPADDEELPKL